MDPDQTAECCLSATKCTGSGPSRGISGPSIESNPLIWRFRDTMARLEEGVTAPPFTLEDHDGTPVSLSTFLGRRVVIYFYPKDDTPGCTKEACQFNENLATFAASGVDVLGISPDKQATHVKFRTKYDLAFSLLSDPDRSVMTAYGAFGEKMMYGKKTMGVIRSTFLIGTDGTIEKAWYNVRADGHAAKVLDALG